MSGCVIWLRATSSGYGVKSRNGRMRYVHRLSWELEHGPIPKGMHVLHHCDTPPCFNFEHLFLGTNHDNQQDSVAKGRHAEVRRTLCPRGHPYDRRDPNAGHRYCRACDTANTRNFRKRKDEDRG
jgi:hypothetical protein